MTSISPIFLFSLPRSGSTLLQRILGAHSQIATAPEPWILLPYLYALRPEGAYAEYGHRTSVKAIQGLLARLPNGRQDYLDEVRGLALRLYGKAAGSGGRYFLDKTPRYNLVADDVLEAFPDANYIALWRNPLAVIASILDTWLGGRWMPYHHKVDLYEGLERVLEVYARQPQRWISVRYEDLVTAPENELKRVLARLDLAWEPAMVEDLSSQRISGAVGDSTGVHAYQQVSSAPLYKWHQTLASPIRKRWCHRYLRWIGPARLSLMGYEMDSLLAELEAIPTRYGSVPADGLSTARGMAWSLLEPDIARAKVARLPRWRRVYSHT